MMTRDFCVFLCFVCSLFVNCQFAGGTCRTINGGTGTCMVVYSCESFMAVMRDGIAISNPITTWMLRQAHCGFDGNSPKVCCPNNDQKANLKEPVTQASTSTVLSTIGLPSMTTNRPSMITLPPSTTTQAPSTTTQAPSTTTQGPSTTTRAPSTTTRAASMNTRAPSTTTRAASTTTRSTSTASTTHPSIEIPAKTNQPEYNYDLISLLGETCTTVYNTTGSCKEVFLCEPFSPLMKTARSNPADVKILRQSHCGFVGTRPKVCCPLPGQPTTLVPPVTILPSTGARAGGDYLTSLPEPPVCGDSNVTLHKVVNGVPARLGSFPWMALLAYRDLSLASGIKWNCGGSLISIRHVLTAAHCIHSLENDLIFVRLGELDWARDDEGATPIDVPIKEMIKHEKYTRNNPVRYDIGVLVLQRDIEFTALIKPICLPLKFRSMKFEDYNPFVAGWGNVNRQRNGIAATHLQVAQVTVLGQKVCEQAYQNFIYDGFYEQAFCAGYMTGEIDTCAGDSGGPLMQYMPGERAFTMYCYCTGVVSFGRGCAQAGSPGVYARVTHYLPWLEEKLLGKTTT